MSTHQHNHHPVASRPTLWSRGAHVAASLLFATTLGGCASLDLDDPVLSGVIQVERIGTPRAAIASVNTRDHQGQLEVYGRLQRSSSSLNVASGHLHIEAIGQDGQTLATTVADYRPLSRRMGQASFSRTLNVQPEQVRLVRLIHHDRDDPRALQHS